MFHLKEIKLVDVIAISTGIESIAIRSVLESFNLQVRMSCIGNVQHLLSLFEDKNYLHDIIIISCHGDKEGLFLPALDSELEKDMPYQRKLTANNCLYAINLDNQIVINTGCCLGNNEFANNVLSKGAKGYIGAINYIDSDTMLLFISTFLYFYLKKNYSLTNAFKKAQVIEENTNSFKMYTKN